MFPGGELNGAVEDRQLCLVRRFRQLPLGPVRINLGSGGEWYDQPFRRGELLPRRGEHGGDRVVILLRHGNRRTPATSSGR
jgi:hypothetical protein